MDHQQLYGCTETTGGITCSDLDDISIGRVGAPFYGLRIRLLDWPEGGYTVHDRPNPRGEIVVGGDTITKGYFKLPNQTKESYYQDQDQVDIQYHDEYQQSMIHWFKTGDIGEVFPNGTIRIIDRKKDLIKLQHGEYVSLGKIESELKSCPLVENICLYGEFECRRLIAFILPNVPKLKEISEEITISNHKTKKQEEDYPSLDEICSNQSVLDHVTGLIQKFCQEANLTRYETPERVKLCTDEWSVESGHLTATMKINRQNIFRIYREDIRMLMNQ